MVKLIGRLGARLGAVALVAAGGLAVTALPAGAAPGVDLALAVQSGVVASGSAGKPFTAKITNLGDTKSEGFSFLIETTSVYPERARVDLPDEFDEFCETQPQVKKIICEFGNVLVRGDSLEIPILVTPVSGGGTGEAGSFAVTVISDQDTNMRNNSVGVQLGVSAPGVDIVVWAEDVVAGRDDETGEAKRLPPGSTGSLLFGLANGGSLAADGIELTLRLPEHVTFVTTPEGCTITADKRQATCSEPDLQLPANRFLEGTVDVRVAADAPQSVELTGSVEGRALGVDDSPADSRRSISGQPGWLKAAQNDFDPKEVDNHDNSDAFAVLVGATTGGGGGGDGGGLPTTGPKAVVIGGIGAAVLVAGVVLLVVARRRRVVLVIPSE
jgi:hypothetical protein